MRRFATKEKATQVPKGLAAALLRSAGVAPLMAETQDALTLVKAVGVVAVQGARVAGQVDYLDRAVIVEVEVVIADLTDREKIVRMTMRISCWMCVCSLGLENMASDVGIYG